MTLATNMKKTPFLISALAFLSLSQGFILRPQRSSQLRTATTIPTASFATADDNNSNDSILEDPSYEPQYGVSFIGGDPCGSKLNTDPHDAQIEKPGMPDSMKARIQALADKRKREEEEREENE